MNRERCECHDCTQYRASQTPFYQLKVEVRDSLQPGASLEKCTCEPKFSVGDFPPGHDFGCPKRFK